MEMLRFALHTAAVIRVQVAETGVHDGPTLQQQRTENNCDAPQQSPRLPGRPLRLAILMNHDPEFLLKLGDKNAEPTKRGMLVQASWNCYCLIHGYSCLYDPVRVGFLNSTGHNAAYRMRTVLKYLPFYDYVVQISLDVMAVNRSFRFEQFLDGSPDVVLSVRSNLWQRRGREQVPRWRAHLDKRFPSSTFPARPARIDWPVMLHTEVVIVKNSPNGARFADHVVRHRGLVKAETYDMAAAHSAALTFVGDVGGMEYIRQFEHNLSRRRPTYLLDDWMGFKGPISVPTGGFYLPLDVLYYNLTARVLQQRRDWVHPLNGHLRLLSEGEMLRDWATDKLLRNGDFIVHSKLLFKADMLGPDDADCLPSQNAPRRFADTLHEDWFASDQDSRAIAARYGYDFLAVFGKGAQPTRTDEYH